MNESQSDQACRDTLGAVSDCPVVELDDLQLQSVVGGSYGPTGGWGLADLDRGPTQGW